MTTTPTIEMQVTLTMDEAEAKRVRSSNGDIQVAANTLINEYAKGGIMINADRVRYLSTCCNTPLRTSNDVMEVVENAVNKRAYDGSKIVTYRLDPAFAAPLEEIARMSGRNVDDIVQEAISIVFTNAWLYSIEVSGGTVHFEKSQRQEIEDMMGQKFSNGADLHRWIKEIHAQVATPPPIPEQSEEEPRKKDSMKAVVRAKLDEIHTKIVQSVQA